jgi:hypothetical protein
MWMFYYLAQDCWYLGTVARYHRRKRRHRVEYDDGDHEWINFTDECDRVQVQQEDGLWNMVRVHITNVCGLFYDVGLLSDVSRRVQMGTLTVTSPPWVCGSVFLCMNVSLVQRLLPSPTTLSPLRSPQYTMYQSEAMQNEYRKKEAKREKENYQAQAFRDANQWRSFVDDVSKEVMFLSNITGECGVLALISAVGGV